MIAPESTEIRVGLSFSGIVKQYGNQDVLRGASGNIGRGEIAVVLGPNGAGTSTLLAILSTLILPDAGSFVVAGATRPIDVRSRLALVPHRPLLTPALTVHENLVVAAGLHGLSTAATRDRIARLVDELGLASFMSRQAGHCSRGQAQRASLAVALMHDPPVLLLDEPFTGLDAAARDQLSSRVRAWRDDGRTVLLVTHELADGLALADRVGCLVRGKIFEPPDELRRDPTQLAHVMSAADEPA